MIKLTRWRPSVTVALILSTILLVPACKSVSHQSRVAAEDNQAQNIDPDLLPLQRLLDLDRFQYYMTDLAHHLKGRNLDDVVAALQDLSPAKVLALNIDPKVLADTTMYDDQIIKILKKNYKNVSFDPASVRWEYNFYKRKLQAAFTLKTGKTQPTANYPALSTQELVSTMVDVPARAKDQVLFESDQYAANKTTRAVFWDVVENGRAIEYHMGTEQDFQERLISRKGTVVAEIEPLASNFNKKIYVIALPGEADYRYAVTGLTGADRANHLIRELSAITPLSKSKVPKKVQMFGDASDVLNNDQASIERELSNVPKADIVVIGQKGAFENTFRAAAKLEALRRLAKKAPGVIDGNDIVALQKLFSLADQSGSMFIGTKPLDSAAQLYDKYLDSFAAKKVEAAADPKALTFDNPSHDISDFAYTDSNGKKAIARLISNVWGDEIEPIANALVNTGHDRIVYIGTAGGLPNKGIEVGDLIYANTFISETGESIKLGQPEFVPDGAKLGTVVQVVSPYEETTSWAKQAASHGDVVEVETFRLAQALKGKKVKLSAFLLVSDVLGTDEGLNRANSGSREKALRSVLDATFKATGGVAALAAQPNNYLAREDEDQFAAWIDELAPSRDSVSKYQVKALAEAQGIETKADMQALLKEQKAFTTDYVETRLTQAGEVYNYIVANAKDQNIEVKSYLPTELMTGAWNPKTAALTIVIKARSTADVSALQNILAQAYQQQPDATNAATIQIQKEPVTGDYLPFITPANPDRRLLVSIYSAAAAENSGLLAGESRTGRLKFVQLPDAGPGGPGGAVNSKCSALKAQWAKYMQPAARAKL